jgi:hypothetical protein
MDQELDPVLHQSWLVVVWFQDDLARPIADFVGTAARALVWEDHARTSNFRWCFALAETGPTSQRRDIGLSFAAEREVLPPDLRHLLIFVNEHEATDPQHVRDGPWH